MGLNDSGEEFDALNEFGYHPGTAGTKPIFTDIRQQFIAVAEFLDGTLPEGRHKDIALMNLQQSQMWSVASIAINHTPVLSPEDDE